MLKVHDQPFGNSTSFSTAGVLQAETLAQAAERGGKKVVQIDGPAAAPHSLVARAYQHLWREVQGLISKD